MTYNNEAMHHRMLAQEMFDFRKLAWKKDRFEVSGDRVRMTHDEWHKLGHTYILDKTKNRVKHAELIVPVSKAQGMTSLLMFEKDRFMEIVLREGPTGKGSECHNEVDALDSFTRLMRMLTVCTLTALSMERTTRLFGYPQANFDVLMGIRDHDKAFGEGYSKLAELMHPRMVQKAHQGLLETVTNALLDKGGPRDSALNGKEFYLRRDLRIREREQHEKELQQLLTICLFNYIKQVDAFVDTVASGLTVNPAGQYESRPVFDTLHDVVTMLRGLLVTMSSSDDIGDPGMISSEMYCAESSIGGSLIYLCAMMAMTDGIPARLRNEYEQILQYPWPPQERKAA